MRVETGSFESVEGETKTEKKKEPEKLWSFSNYQGTFLFTLLFSHA